MSVDLLKIKDLLRHRMKGGAGGGGSIMMDENVDSDLIDLLTKRMETK